MSSFRIIGRNSFGQNVTSEITVMVKSDEIKVSRGVLALLYFALIGGVLVLLYLI